MRYYFFIFTLLVTFHTCLPQVILKPALIDLKILVPRVVRGIPAKLGEFPYQVALKMLVSRSREIYDTFCGGTIIGPAKILTAAHCYVEDKSNCKKCALPGHISKKGTVAVAGTLLTRSVYSYKDSLEGGQWRKINTVKFPKSYKFPKHDIALAFTESPFVFNANVAPIKYARQFFDYTGTCLVSGFGLIGPSKYSPGSSVLLKAELELIPWSWCNRILGRNMREFVCTSTKVTDVGNGDSGGPLVCNTSEGRVLVGVVSGSYPRRASFFTRVSSFHKYVDGNTTCEQKSKIFLKVWSCLYIIYVWISLF